MEQSDSASSSSDSQFSEEEEVHSNEEDNHNQIVTNNKNDSALQVDPRKIPPQLLPLYAYVTELLKNYKMGDVKLHTFLNYKLSKENQGQRLVCAKIVTPRHKIVECLDCRMDSSCIICEECFNDGDHQGHRYKVRTGSGGCCDCGDKQAWKPSGFCRKHTGESKPVEVSPADQQLFNLYWSHLFTWYFAITNVEERKKFGQYIFKFLTIFVAMPLYNALLTSFFSTPVPQPLMEDLLKLQRFKKGDSFAQVIILNAQQTHHKNFEELCILMFPNYKFKQLITYSFMKIYSQLGRTGKFDFSNMSCQLLTSYQLVEDALQRLDEQQLVAHKKDPKKSAKFFLDNKAEFKSKEQSFEVYFRYIIDIRYLISLSNGVGLKYWKNHISQIKNLEGFATVDRFVEKHWKNNHEDAALTDFYYVNMESIDCLFKGVNLLKEEAQRQGTDYLLSKIGETVRYLAHKQTVSNSCYFIIHRFLAILLVAYLDYQPANILKNSELTKLLQENILKIFQPFFHSISLLLSKWAKPQLKQLHYRYYQVYSDAYRESFSMDAFMLKLFAYVKNYQSSTLFEGLSFFILNNCSQKQVAIFNAIRKEPATGFKTENFQELALKVSANLSLNTELCISKCEQLNLCFNLQGSDECVARFAPQITRLLKGYLSSGCLIKQADMQQFTQFFFNKGLNIDKLLAPLSRLDKTTKRYPPLKLNSPQKEGLGFEFYPSKNNFTAWDTDKIYIGKTPIKPDAELVRMLLVPNVQKLIGLLNMGKEVLKNQKRTNTLTSSVTKLLIEATKMYYVIKETGQFTDTIHQLLAGINREMCADLLQNSPLLDILPVVEKPAQTMEIEQQSPVLESKPNLCQKSISSEPDKSKADKAAEAKRKIMEKMKQKAEKFKQTSTNILPTIKAEKGSMTKIQEQEIGHEEEVCVYCHSNINKDFFVYGAVATWSNMYSKAMIASITQNKLPKASTPAEKLFWQAVLQDYTEKSHKGNIVFTSCYHPLHYSCYLEVSNKSHTPFCPMCKRYCNIMIPVSSRLNLEEVDTTKQQLNCGMIFMNILQKIDGSYTNSKAYTKKGEMVLEQGDTSMNKGLTLLLKSYAEVLGWSALNYPDFYHRKMRRLYKILLTSLKATLKFLIKIGSKDKLHFDLKKIEQEEFRCQGLVQILETLKKKAEQKQKTAIQVEGETENQGEDDKGLGETQAMLEQFKKYNFELEVISTMVRHWSGVHVEEEIIQNYKSKMTPDENFNTVIRKRSASLLSLLDSSFHGLTHYEQKLQAVQALPLCHSSRLIVNPRPLVPTNLPTRYPPLDKVRSKCPNCNKLGNYTVLCLLCPWKGCKKCPVDPMNLHSTFQHAHNCVFLLVDSTQFVFMTFDSCAITSPVYTDLLGQPFNVFKEWDNFELQAHEYEQAVRRAVEFDIMTYVKYRQAQTHQYLHPEAF